jgi:3-hydroxyisobutyrate dehydrogenase-like beta-hydroxyacid dehydrogenase
VTTWGMVGLGEMGLPMARNLVAAGIPTAGYDPDPRARAEAAEAGVSLVEAPRDLLADCEVVGVCVRDEAQCLEVADALGDGSRIVVLHSTIGPSGARRLAERVGARGHRLLDAPISGMAMRAQAGTLTFLVGGGADDLELARSGLLAMGERIFHLGGIGTGQVAKLANNLASLSTVLVVHEAIELGVRGGVPEEAMLEVLRASSGDSWIARNWSWLRHDWRHEHPLGGDGVGDMVGKDLRLALAVGDEVGLALPSTALAAQLVPLVVGRDQVVGDAPRLGRD